MNYSLSTFRRVSEHNGQRKIVRKIVLKRCVILIARLTVNFEEGNVGMEKETEREKRGLFSLCPYDPETVSGSL